MPTWREGIVASVIAIAATTTFAVPTARVRNGTSYALASTVRDVGATATSADAGAGTTDLDASAGNVHVPTGFGAGEIIRVTVVGGRLELRDDETTVRLQRSSGASTTWTAALPAVRVIDARGTHAGWTVRWIRSALAVTPPRAAPPGRVDVEPGPPVVVDGAAVGITRGHGRTLLAAESGTGGGTYEAGGRVWVRFPAGFVPHAVTVRLAFLVESASSP